ncbi:uncharacterized protein LOC115876328 [Sitophilus oryzae]|uniref:Uncharacterized protein LOC115876328 n=1 Tax=Sitophilus oryzae TaxID=7048 RepID=A0A6J2X9J8_SITOR|nr:uncharacterized protein LOC115876328 [Sitophilus oryzae]
MLLVVSVNFRHFWSDRWRCNIYVGCVSRIFKEKCLFLVYCARKSCVVHSWTLREDYARNYPGLRTSKDHAASEEGDDEQHTNTTTDLQVGKKPGCLWMEWTKDRYGSGHVI